MRASQAQAPGVAGPPPATRAGFVVEAGGTAAGSAIRVSGLVQGVGFRPTAWRLARDCGLQGDVRNDGAGVLIRVWGLPVARQQFLRRLRREAPPLARIDSLSVTALRDGAPQPGFSIVASIMDEVRTGVVPDAATCAACRTEIFDRNDRRAGYAFGNCTHCGPRLSVASSVPWDRCNTSMAAFKMCPACRSEYEDPADRRFHAQPIACPTCGPSLWLESSGDSFDIDHSEEPLAAAQRLIAAGFIVAIKGVGGIHLACDAGNATAVDRLRRRKRRYDKPFALMATDMRMIRRYCHVERMAAALLESPAAPIVLLPANGARGLAGGVAPGQSTYGFMLPYSPLHHLLMSGLDAPIVLTSGNRAEEPQCIRNHEARANLGDIVDALLLNDRDIVNRMDDSVVRVIAGRTALLRRARGYAPASLRMPPGFGDAPAVLAMGGELKNTFCLLRDGEAIVSQHLGDLENAAANAAYRNTLERFLELFDHVPRHLAVDAHPDYLASKLGRERAAADGIAAIDVQHHHAHIAACLADNGVGLDAPGVLGIALDGIGYGDDGSLWGGEFMLADYRDYRRLAAFAPVRMPGSVQAIHEPWRMGLAHLRELEDWEDWRSRCAGRGFFRTLAGKPLATLDAMLHAGFNSPVTSSCGRLFDAVAAVVGLRQAVTYEGQAAIELEAAVDPAALRDGRAYPFAIVTGSGMPVLGVRPMWRALLGDLQADVPRGVMAARFHAGLAQGVVSMVDHLTQAHDDAWSGRIALSGGVFQNACFSALLIAALEAGGRQVLRHERVPANDGGLSLGQASVAAARAIARRRQGEAACA